MLRRDILKGGLLAALTGIPVVADSPVPVTPLDDDIRRDFADIVYSLIRADDRVGEGISYTFLYPTSGNLVVVIDDLDGTAQGRYTLVMSVVDKMAMGEFVRHLKDKDLKTRELMS